MDGDATTDPQTVIVTGAAGFIGFHMAARLLDAGRTVVGVDNLNAYYDPALKRDRLALLEGRPGFRFVQADIADREATAALFAEARPRHVVHLAAQAGVRYSLENPFAYADSNLTGFLSVLEACRHGGTAHLLYASSSSVYGGNTRLPFSTADSVDHPVSLYAATKKANELMAHAYSHLYGLPTTGLRFFTVYGRWGRPDMAYWKFTEAILADRPIDVYAGGAVSRDFTHVDDVVAPMCALLDRPARPDPDFDSDRPDPARSNAPWRVYNIGATRPTPLPDMIAVIERAAGRRARMRMLPPQPGDVAATWADGRDLERETGCSPRISLEEGLTDFVVWFRERYPDGAREA